MNRSTVILEDIYRTTSSFTLGNTTWTPIPRSLVIYEDSDDIESSSDFRKKRQRPDRENTDCPFIADWQENTSAFPTCNILHEVGLHMGGQRAGDHRIEQLAHGGFKDVWKVRLEDDTPAEYVLKTSKYDIKFSPRDLDLHRKDALIMGQTTASPYVLNMYSYCAFSNLVESAPSTLEDWIDRRKDTTKSDELLNLAYQVAQGVADMHLFHNGMATVAHIDIKPSQFLYSPKTKVFKINDFNRGRLLTSKAPPKICPFTFDCTHNGSTRRAPEEYTEGGLQSDKSDVFTMGSIFYILLAEEDPFEKYRFEKAIKAIVKGEEPSLPDDIVDSKDPNLVAIVDAMRWCRQYKAEDRPTSLQVAQRLKEALEKVRG
jgi:serine/threonine protein kinase